MSKTSDVPEDAPDTESEARTEVAATDAQMNLRIAVLAELSAAMRGQSQAEFVYTAAAVGGFSAIFLGISTLAPTDAGDPARLMAAVFILSVGAFIAFCIRGNHRTYLAIYAARKKVADEIDGLPCARGIVPAKWKEQTAAIGAWRSILIVLVSAASAAAYCLYAYFH